MRADFYSPGDGGSFAVAGDPPHTSAQRFELAAVLRASQDAILVVDRSGVVTDWSDSALELFGYEPGSLRRLSLVDLVEGAVQPGDLPQGAPHEMMAARASGEQFPALVTASASTDPGCDEWIVCLRDISERKNMAAKLDQLAFNDPLTALANRALFNNGVNHALKRLGRKASNVGVLFLDLDDFKRINDSFGHAVGDTLLISVAERLRRCVRSSDTVARLGGDEFAILVEDANDVLTSLEIADRIVAAMGPSFLIGSIEIDVSCSVGVALATEPSVQASDLLRDADLAMYAAKSRGKNCIELYENSMHTAILDRVHLEGDLRHAVERGQMIPHYQPIFELATGRITGFEALAGWYHPERGIVEPGLFIEIAESTGLIVGIGTAILNTACEQASQWAKQFPHIAPIKMSVNLSGRQIEDPSVVATVAESIRRSGLDPRSLTLEITESLMVKETRGPRDRLRYLAQLGVGLVVDDFGTGYSSLSYLQDLPLTGLKVDRSFVKRIGEPRGDSLIGAILAMSKSLGFTVVAEGIETADHLRSLAKARCEMGQGYLFARPLPADEAAEFLSRTQPFGF